MPPDRKRLKLSRPEEITFDPAARHEYLTGFHKRKQERSQAARDAAAKRAKEDRVRERRQLREQRKEDLEKHVAAVKAELLKLNEDVDGGAELDGEGDEWEGVEEGVGVVPLEEDAEYVDEEKYTTVTVEAMNPNGEESEEEDVGVAADEAKIKLANGHAPYTAKKKRIWSKDPTNPNSVKKKKKQFRYESKAERQATRQKQKLKNRAMKARREGK